MFVSRNAFTDEPASGADAGSSAGHDLFARDGSEEDPAGLEAGGGGYMPADSRAAMLERQRQLAAAKAKERMASASTFTPAASSLGGSSLAGMSGAPGRSIARGAPVMSAPRLDTPGSGFGAALASKSSVAMASTHSIGGDPTSPSSAASSLAEAIRERERRAREGVPTHERVPESALEREMAARGISSTFDPSAPAGASGSAPSVRAAAAAAATTLPASPAYVEEAPPPHAAAGKDGLMPVAPLMGGPIAVHAPRGGPSAAVLLETMDLRTFCLSPTPRTAGVVHCYIVRERIGLTGRMYPTYCLYLKDGDRFLMAARKRGNNKTSNYLISLDKRDLNRDSASFIGKLRANFVGTEFVCYDDGVSPEKRAESGSLRQELCIMTYASNVLGSRGPRKMKVAVPKINTDGRRVIFQPDRDEDTMLSKFRAGYVQDMTTLINKPPKWNDQVGAYVLNFNGRVTMASVKNFQLVAAEDQETVLLQFGRTGKDEFTMDYQWPLCPLQAFAICMSSFDYKLACE